MQALNFAGTGTPAASGGFESALWDRCRPVTVLLLTLAAGFVLSSSAPPFGSARTAAPAAYEAETVPPSSTAATVNLPLAKPTATRNQNVAALAGFIARRYRISTAATSEYVGLAFREAERHGLDPFLLVALMAVESSFNPSAESQAGALGLMQVIPQYHTDKFDPVSESVLHPPTNIRIGAKVLKEYIRRGGSLVDGLQMYNGSTDDETTAFANKVLSEKERLQGAVKGAGVKA